jgi:CspA family cold shock protein
MAFGTVKAWHYDEGWGVLTSPEVPSDVWVHFSCVEGSGDFVFLTAGESVEFDYESAGHGGQDGYSYRATTVRRGSETDE